MGQYRETVLFIFVKKNGDLEYVKHEYHRFHV